MAERIKVLIVDDNQETREGTRRLLEYEDDIEIVDFADNGAVAIEKVREHNPDVVLMDINMPVMDGLTATQRLRDEFPRSQIIIVSVQDDANYLREAIRAGAADFVAKPISSEEMAEAIRRAYDKIPAKSAAPQEGAPAGTPSMPSLERRRGGAEGRVISIIGPKGGVGRTTIAINLGIGLVRQSPERRVLIIDGNIYFGDVGVFLNTRGQYSLLDMVAMAEIPEEIDPASVDSILVPHESGVKLLVAPTSPGDANQVSLSGMINMLDHLKKLFDYIIIDTGPTIDDVLAGAIQGSDRLIMVSAPLMPALKDARVMLGELRSVDYAMGDVLLVLNAVPKDSRITGEQIANFLKREVQIEIPYDATINEALNRGVPLVTLDPRRVPSVNPLLGLVKIVTKSFETEEALGTGTADGSQRSRGGLFGALRS
jgi:pilus assembly protein CpaE